VRRPTFHLARGRCRDGLAAALDLDREGHAEEAGELDGRRAGAAESGVRAAGPIVARDLNSQSSPIPRPATTIEPSAANRDSADASATGIWPPRSPREPYASPSGVDRRARILGPSSDTTVLYGSALSTRARDDRNRVSTVEHHMNG